MRAIAAVIALMLLGACARAPSLYRDEFLSMGTTVSVAIATDDAQSAGAALGDTERLAQQYGREWYPWNSAGELAQLNDALARGAPAQISPPLLALLSRSRELFIESDGYFDPAVAPLVRLWGFDRSERAPNSPLPDERALNAWCKEHPTFADLQWRDTTVSSERSDLQLDLGAIGKGRIVDLAIELLRARGFHDAMVDAGGNLRAIGRAGDRPWRIALRDPRGDGALGWLDLSGDESVSTSGDYERYAVVNGERIHHVLDPHTGRPATHTIAVTVLAPDATTADAASTALMAAGPEHWVQLARKMKLKYVLRVASDSTIEMSSGLRSRLRIPASLPREHSLKIIEL